LVQVFELELVGHHHIQRILFQRRIIILSHPDHARAETLPIAVNQSFFQYFPHNLVDTGVGRPANQNPTRDMAVERVESDTPVSEPSLGEEISDLLLKVKI
jgi:hypothetical protein